MHAIDLLREVAHERRTIFLRRHAEAILKALPDRNEPEWLRSRILEEKLRAMLDEALTPLRDLLANEGEKALDRLSGPPPVFLGPAAVEPVDQ